MVHLSYRGSMRAAGDDDTWCGSYEPVAIPSTVIQPPLALTTYFDHELSASNLVILYGELN